MLHCLLWFSSHGRIHSQLQISRAIHPGFRCTGQLALQPTVIRVLLRRAKTDLFGKGVFIHLGRTGADLCPVVAMLNYMVIRPKLAGPLFLNQEGQPLTKDTLIREVRAVLEAANLNPRSYAGHSFRIGVATSAARLAGVPDHLIKVLGRWKLEAYHSYIWTPAETLSLVSSRIASPSLSQGTYHDTPQCVCYYFVCAGAP